MAQSLTDDWEPVCLNSTIVLVGCSGSGKSATGNTILGRKSFKSMASTRGTTSTCELQRVPRDGRTINVLDMPGIIEFSGKSEELTKYNDLTKNGIHAMLFVVSVRTQFSKQEAAVCSLQTLFGSKIVDYMIVVFTGGDELDDNEETFQDYLTRDLPAEVKVLIQLCGDRKMLIDNRTKNEEKNNEQVKELLQLVNKVAAHNGERPYMLESSQLQNGAKNFNKSLHGKLEEIIYNSSGLMVNETTSRLEQQVAEAHAKRQIMEMRADEAQKESEEQIKMLREYIVQTRNENEEVQKSSPSTDGKAHEVQIGKAREHQERTCKENEQMQKSSGSDGKVQKDQSRKPREHKEGTRNEDGAAQASLWDRVISFFRDTSKKQQKRGS